MRVAPGHGSERWLSIQFQFYIFDWIETEVLEHFQTNKSSQKEIQRITYGRKSADRTEPHFGVIFFVFLSTFFGNLEVCDVKTCNIF